MTGISERTKERLLRLLHLLEKHSQEGHGERVSSAQVEQLTGWSRETIRKDISSLGALIDKTESAPLGDNMGYDPCVLSPLIKKALGLDRIRKFCVVGLGRLGSAYLNFTPPELAEFELAAGFDINVNRVEILHSRVPLYPAYKMGEVIGRFGIEIALLCIPVEAAQAAAEKCVAAGIRGIVNFVPAALKLPPEIAVHNVYITDELRSISVKITNEEML